MSSARADEVVLDGFATLNYPAEVKLKAKGCQEIPIRYVTDDNLSRENTVFLVSITPTNSKQSHGYAAWFSTQTAMGEKALPPMARIGALQVKVCRKAFIYSTAATKKTPGIKPGKYRIFFNAGNMDPESGRVVGEKIEIIRVIKFY
jgi:hypothetical protein